MTHSIIGMGATGLQTFLAPHAGVAFVRAGLDETVAREGMEISRQIDTRVKCQPIAKLCCQSVIFPLPLLGGIT